MKGTDKNEKKHYISSTYICPFTTFREVKKNQ